MEDNKEFECTECGNEFTWCERIGKHDDECFCPVCGHDCLED